MKYAAAAAAGAIALVGAAVAQTTTAPSPPPVFPPLAQCGAYPAPLSPGLPDGGKAKAKDMEAAQTRFKGWFDAQQAAFNCRKGEVERVQPALTPYLAHYNAMVDEAKSGGANLKTQTDAWQAEIDKYNARNKSATTHRSGTGRTGN